MHEPRGCSRPPEVGQDVDREELALTRLLVVVAREPAGDEADDAALLRGDERVVIRIGGEAAGQAFPSGDIDPGQPVRAEDVLVGGLPGAYMYARDRGGVLEPRAPDFDGLLLSGGV
jgi:hypothetical protein